MRVGIVAEGSTDIAILIGMVHKWLDCNCDILPLQPRLDKSGRQQGQGNWQEVESWCRYRQNRNILAQFQSAAQDTDAWEIPAPPAKLDHRTLLQTGFIDAIIIQMDTDIASEIRNITPPYNTDTETPVAFCYRAINTWLGNGWSKDKILLVLPTPCTESWILATFSKREHPDAFPEVPTPRDYEILGNIFIRLEKIIQKLRRNSSESWDKSAVSYNRVWLPRIIQYEWHVRWRCTRAKSFIEALLFYKKTSLWPISQ